MAAQVIWNATLYALLSFSTGILGACVATFQPPGEKVRSYIQDFAAGVGIDLSVDDLLIGIGFPAGQTMWRSKERF